MGTVPTRQVACVKIVSKVRPAKRTKKLNVCGLSPFFPLYHFCNGHNIEGHDASVNSKKNSEYLSIITW
jgi:hypothetical protein